jgi:putative molybdopterin biosynthesis protein
MKREMLTTKDVGMGILASAKSLGLDFIPVATERFDLIIPNGNLMTEPVQAWRKVLVSDEFKSNVIRMGGYSTRDTGKVMWERV